MPCCRQSSATESPFSACFKIDRICGSEYLLGFINISSFIKPKKILLIKPIIFRGDYLGFSHVMKQLGAWPGSGLSEIRIAELRIRPRIQP